MNEARIKKWSFYKRALIAPKMSMRESTRLLSEMDESAREYHNTLLRMERKNNEKGN